MRQLILNILVLSILFIIPAQAQTAPAALPPAGETVLNLAATEHSEIAQDILTATLAIEKQGADAVSLQRQINTIMAQGVAKAKTVSDVEVSTGQYNVYPVDPDPNAKVKAPRTWRGSQTLILKGTQADALLTLTGALQDLGLSIQDLSYSVSPAKEEAARDALMEATLGKLRDKAMRAAKALGKTKVDFAAVNVDGAASPPVMRPMMRAMAMSADAAMPAPTAAAGKTAIDLTVTAQVVLRP